LIVDDAVLCTHSAIPPAATPLNGLLKLPRVLPSLERNCKLAYDIITRYPKLSTIRPKPVTKTKPANKQANCKDNVAEKSKSAKGSVAKSSEFGSIKSVSTGTVRAKQSNSDILFCCRNAQVNRVLPIVLGNRSSLPKVPRRAPTISLVLPLSSRK